MRRIVLCSCTAVLVFLATLPLCSVKAQSVGYGKVEIGAGVGPLFFLGDLGGNFGRGSTFVKDVNLPTTNLSFGAYINVHPTEWLGFRFAFNTGKLEGADSLINEKGGAEISRKVRNLHFRSKLTEAFAAIEFYPTVFFEQYDGLKGKLRPYGVLGVGAFKFNPQTQYYSPNGTIRWVNLRDLGTEGQGMEEYPNRKKYSLTQLEIPMGVGAKYYVSENMYIGFEILHRKTFTDYMDDVSTSYINPDLFDKYLLPEDAVVARQVYYRGFTASSRPDDGEMRGQRRNNDSFFSSLIRMGWRLGTGGSTPGNMRCPKF